MNGLVQMVSDTVCRRCQTSDCGRDGCNIQMDGVPDPHVVVDLDCEPLGLLEQKRCDLLFVGEDDDEAWVAPIELKSGRFTGYQVVKQLQGGADAADGWLPAGSAFRFVPVLAHGREVHRRDLKALRSKKVTLRDHTRQTVLMRCGEPLKEVLEQAKSLQ